MKRKIFKLICALFIFVFVFFTCVRSYSAQSANAQGGSGSSGNSGIGCAAGVACGIHKAHEVRVKLVYYDGKNTTVLAGPTRVAPGTWGWYDVGTEYWFNSDNFEHTVVGSNNDAKEKRRQKLQDFVNTIGWHIDLNTLNKTSCEVNRKGNCYGKAGYRVIAELYLGLSVNEGDGIGTDYRSVKTLNNDIHLLDNPALGNYRGTHISDEMSIKWADINYRCSKGTNNNKGVCNKHESVGCLTDKNCGNGIWIVDISKAISNKNDYSLDSACVGCKTSTKTGNSYIIQDVDNWNLLKQVGKLDVSDDTKTVRNYYMSERVAGHICREQYKIIFPTSSKVTVERGSYFTINESAGFPNFEPFRVERVIQCIKENGTKGDLSKVKAKYCKSKADFDPGKVKIWYNEKEGAGYDHYTLPWTNMKAKDADLECNATQSGDVAMLTISGNYKLPDDTYRYIRNGTNRPLATANGISSSELKKKYTAALVPNLPVALNHKVTKKSTIGGYISLKFDFASNSNMKKAFKDANNQYLKVGNQDIPSRYNIYKQWADDRSKVESDPVASVTIKNSACAKMHGYGTDDFVSCVNERKNSISDKIAKCKARNSASINADSDVNNGYTCPIYMDPDPVDNSCKIIDLDHNKFVLSDGSSSTSKNEFTKQCCNVDNHSILGRDWNPNLNEGKGGCCPANQTYNTITKKCENVPSPCTKDNVGTGPYKDYIWALMNDSSGKGVYGCCSPQDYSAGKCSGKTGCVDGVNGTCGGDSKTCVCTIDGLCPEDHLNKQCPTSRDSCAKQGGKYYIGGSEVTKERYADMCCNEKNHSDSDIGRDWNPNNGGYCCAPGEKYNSATKTCGPKDACDYCSEASLCCEAGHKYKCGVKDINGNLVCDDGKVFDPDELIYRTIDLGTPFVGEEGKNRSTGTNWAYKSSDGKIINNSAGNSLAKAIIDTNEDVYSEDHVLYRFNIDSENISQIRNYNKKQKNEGGYSDFTLECKNGSQCTSDFIRDKKYTGASSGICLSNNTNSKDYKKYCK